MGPALDVFHKPCPAFRAVADPKLRSVLLVVGREQQQVAQSGQLFALGQLSYESFSHLDGQAAQLAYLQSYAFIEFLVQEHGERSLRRLCSTLLRKRNLARAFELTYRRGVEDLEARFVSQYRDSAGS